MVLAKLKSRSLLFSRKADCTKYTCDAANQLNWLVDGTGRTTFAYDLNGNQTLELVPVLTRTTNVWDGENRLIVINMPNDLRTTNNYYSEDLLIFQRYPSHDTSITRDESALLVADNVSHNEITIYTNVIRKLSQSIYMQSILSKHNDISSYYQSDGMLSVTEITQGSTASIIDAILYRAFGNIVSDSAPQAERFKYLGTCGYEQLFDGIMNLYNGSKINNNLIYDTNVARIIGHSLMANRYKYNAIINNPLMSSQSYYFSLYLTASLPRLAKQLNSLLPSNAMALVGGRDHEQCCKAAFEYVKKINNGWWPAGLNICCDGRVVPCNFIELGRPGNDNGNDIISFCTSVHEQCHYCYHQEYCTPCPKVIPSIWVPDWRSNRERNMGECATFQMSIICLYERLSLCIGRKDRVLCEQNIRDLIREIVRDGQKEYNCNPPLIGPIEL